MRLRGHIVAVVVALGALGVGALPALASKKDDTVRFPYEQVLDNADPYFNTSRLGIILADNVWDTLIYRDPQTGEYKGDLATAWRWIDDRTLELDLRPGVKFHNGATFDADDVVYTLSFVSRPGTNPPQQSYVRWIDRVQKVDKYRVRIVAKEPFPAAVATLAVTNLVIHPHEYYAKVGPKGMNAHPVGTGPYRVSEHTIGKYIRLERNPDYFTGGPKTQPRINQVEIRFIPDVQTRVAELIAGGVDLIMNVAPDQADQLRRVPTLQILVGGNTRSIFLQMNTMKETPAPQLRDVRVRKAISYAIDRETMAKFLAGKGARVLHTECYPEVFGCTDLGVPRYEYDPAQARRLLADAGYPNGFDIDLYADRDRNAIEAIIGYLRAVGIRAHLRFMQYAAVRAAARAGRVGFTQNVWSGLASDVSNSVSRFHEFSSDDMTRDGEIRDLLLHADSSMDPNLRKSSYAQALKLIAERAYVLPLYSKPTYYLASSALSFAPPPDEIVRFYEMSWK